MNQGQIMQGRREQIASIVLPLVPLVEKLHISEDGTNNPFLQPCQRETNKSGMDFQLHVFPSFLRFITNLGVQNIQFSFQIFFFPPSIKNVPPFLPKFYAEFVSGKVQEQMQFRFPIKNRYIDISKPLVNENYARERNV